MKLSIIIPVYNEQNTILEVIKRLQNTKISKVEKEIIIVDDGSTDSTRKKLANVKIGKVILHEKNQGKGQAVRTGIKMRQGNIF